MTKYLSILLLSLFPLLGIAQSTTPGITQKSIGGYTFLVHLPQGYTKGQLVNVMVGAPGDGETNGPIAKDTINGSFASWNGKPGIRDTTVLNSSLVVLWWNPGVTAPVPSQVQTILTAIKDTFNVYKIAVMGLSMGAQDWGQFAYYQKSNFDQIAAWFIASPEPVNPTPSPTFGGGPIPKTWWALDSVYWHAACATQDPESFFPPTKKTRDSVQASGDFRQPILDSSSCACHSSTVWGPMFSPYVKQQRTGMNIYDEFMTQFPISVNNTGHYYVSTSGSSSNNGIDSLHPIPLSSYLTVAAANDSVYLKGGDIFTQTFYPKSGIVVDTYSKNLGPAIISGFFTLSGGTSLGNNVFQFYCQPATRNTNMLVMNGSIQRIVTYPDNGFMNYTSNNSTTLTGSAVGTLPLNFANTGAWAVVQDEFYIIDTATITAQSSSVLTFASTLAATNGRGDGFQVMNDKRLLSTTSRIGSWFNNYTVDSIQVKLTSGGLGSNVIQVPVLDTLIYFSSDSDITINNVEFMGSNQYSVFMNNAKRINFNNCIFNYGAGNAITGNNCSYTQFNNCTFSNFQNNVAYITGGSSTHNIVQNCMIDSIGLWSGMGHGGTTGTSGYSGWSNISGSFNTWQNNIFKNIGYIPIAFSGDSCNIINNYIDTFCVIKVDGGGIYTWDGSFQSYTYGRFITSNVVLHGGFITTSINYDSTDQSFGIYCDGHSKTVTVNGNTSAYNKSAGVIIHGSSITATSNNFYGNSYTQAYIQEASGITLTGLVFKNNFLGNVNGEYSIVMATPANDLASFGTSDSNYLANTVSNVIFSKSSVDNGTKRSLTNWQSNSSYEAHSSYNSTISRFYYNTGAALSRQALKGQLQDSKGRVYFGTLGLTGFTSMLLFLNNANNTIYLTQPLQTSN